MLKTFQATNERAGIMARILKLKDASEAWRKLIETFRDEPQEGIVRDEDDQTVAVVVPPEQYASYQNYLSQREEDFAILDEIAEKMKNYDPEEIQARIDQAVEEVKAKSRPQRQTV